MAKRCTIQGEGPIRIVRDRHGVPHIRARSRADALRGLGYCHAVDRALQMLLVRIVGAGRTSEILDSGDEMLSVDRFFRRMNFGSDVDAEVAKLVRADRALAEAYCQGVNQALKRRRPWELRLLGYRPAPWTVADTILLSRVAGYVLLAQSQGDVERLLVEMVQAGVPRGHLEELFPGLLQELDVALLRGVKLGERVVPAEVRWSSALPHVLGSNNWVVSPRKTASGRALLANDPHLEANRLPAIWYEAAVEVEERFCIGATMPGLPGFPIGRTHDLAWGATYAFMDATDSWIEDCRDGCYRRVFDGREHWVPCRVRDERIERKGKTAATVRFYETEHGVLDGNASEAGLYLATRWSAAEGTGATSLSAMFGMLDAPDVPTGMDLLGRIETAWNFVLADRHGDIGFQMSGRMPIRRAGWNGFTPVPGWDPQNDWKGFVPPIELPRALNPECGFFATANNDLNHLGRARPINVSQGPYRVDRIASLLAERGDWSVDETERMQMDVFSLQAERVMAVLRPLLPDGPIGEILRSWDCCYERDSQGAYLFERFYRELIVEVFGSVCGAGVWEFIRVETGILCAFYHRFDEVLLRSDSVWFGAEGRDVVFARVAARVLAGEVKTLGEEQQIRLTHLVLGGKLPSWLGFDYGPVALRGGRATIHQTQVYRAGGRDTSFAPSYRFVTDLGEQSVRTCLAGGPSDRRFSRGYTTGIAEWVEGRFKTLKPSRD